MKTSLASHKWEDGYNCYGNRDNDGCEREEGGERADDSIHRPAICVAPIQKSILLAVETGGIDPLRMRSIVDYIQIVATVETGNALEP